MLPIRDDVPHVTTPYINYFLIGINLLVFVFEKTLQAPALLQFDFQFGYVPGRTTAFLLGDHSIGVANAFLPILTCMFLHASWLHVLGNMWFLYIFGDNVEDHFGHLGYLVMYLLSGIFGSVLHTIFNPNSAVPSVGASGAIAGVMGAYFVLYPRARVLTWVFFFVIWMPAWIMLGYWFVVQFLSGAASAFTTAAHAGGGIAVWAHVGGFVAGIILLKLFPSRPRRYQY